MPQEQSETDTHPKVTIVMGAGSLLSLAAPNGRGGTFIDDVLLPTADLPNVKEIIVSPLTIWTRTGKIDGEQIDLQYTDSLHPKHIGYDVVDSFLSSASIKNAKGELTYIGKHEKIVIQNNKHDDEYLDKIVAVVRKHLDPSTRQDPAPMWKEITSLRSQRSPAHPDIIALNAYLVEPPTDVAYGILLTDSFDAGMATRQRPTSTGFSIGSTNGPGFVKSAIDIFELPYDFQEAEQRIINFKQKNPEHPSASLPPIDMRGNRNSRVRGRSMREMLRYGVRLQQYQIPEKEERPVSKRVERFEQRYSKRQQPQNTMSDEDGKLEETTTVESDIESTETEIDDEKGISALLEKFGKRPSNKEDKESTTSTRRLSSGDMERVGEKRSEQNAAKEGEAGAEEPKTPKESRVVKDEPIEVTEDVVTETIGVPEEEAKERIQPTPTVQKRHKRRMMPKLSQEAREQAWGTAVVEAADRLGNIYEEIEARRQALNDIQNVRAIDGLQDTSASYYSRPRNSNYSKWIEDNLREHGLSPLNVDSLLELYYPPGADIQPNEAFDILVHDVMGGYWGKDEIKYDRGLAYAFRIDEPSTPGEVLRAARNERRWSNELLARRSKIREADLREIIDDERPATFEEAQYLVDTFGYEDKEWTNFVDGVTGQRNELERGLIEILDRIEEDHIARDRDALLVEWSDFVEKIFLVKEADYREVANELTYSDKSGKEKTVLHTAVNNWALGLNFVDNRLVAEVVLDYAEIRNPTLIEGGIRFIRGKPAFYDPELLEKCEDKTACLEQMRDNTGLTFIEYQSTEQGVDASRKVILGWESRGEIPANKLDKIIEVDGIPEEHVELFEQRFLEQKKEKKAPVVKAQDLEALFDDIRNNEGLIDTPGRLVKRLLELYDDMTLVALGHSSGMGRSNVTNLANDKLPNSLTKKRIGDLANGFPLPEELKSQFEFCMMYLDAKQRGNLILLSNIYGDGSTEQEPPDDPFPVLYKKTRSAYDPDTWKVPMSGEEVGIAAGYKGGSVVENIEQGIVVPGDEALAKHIEVLKLSETRAGILGASRQQTQEATHLSPP